ncbi:MAG TPA: hypothetical protein VG842_09210 [Sediminibacterium sp.]|nr:hypothetical protein [Sediminibacterium sp.]
MRNLVTVVCLSLLWLASLSCNKKAAVPEIPPDPVGVLAQSASFRDFGQVFLPAMFALAHQHHSAKLSEQRAPFLKQLEIADKQPDALPKIYMEAGLDFELAIGYKNQIDQAILNLFRAHPFLIEMDPAAVGKVIFQAMQVLVNSKDARYSQWQSGVLADIRASLYPGTAGVMPGLNRTGINFVQAGGLTLSEVWNCLVDAAGFGTAGIIGIGGLQKLAKEGIQQIVITLSKFLAKNAGWFGLAITVIELADCVYARAND